MRQETSKRIAVLRMILMVLVVFTHNNGFDAEYTQTVYGVKMLFGEIGSRVAVPLFFFISGYLLFLKDESYGRILKKKTRTLLVPYLLWNGAVLCMLFAGQSIPATVELLQGSGGLLREYSVYQWLDAFLGLNYYGYPAAYQFWFIRDLMILTILYPVWKRLLKRFPAAVFAAAALVWILQRRFVFLDSGAVLFFLAGGYTAWNDPDYTVVERIRTEDLSAAYLLYIAAEAGLIFRGEAFMPVHQTGIILGCMFWLKISKYLAVERRIYERIAPFAGYAFFVYAFHEPVLTVVRKAGKPLFGASGAAVQTAWYFASIFLTIVISIGAGWSISRTSPKLYGWLTGGRTAVTFRKVEEEKYDTGKS